MKALQRSLTFERARHARSDDRRLLESTSSPTPVAPAHEVKASPKSAEVPESKEDAKQIVSIDKEDAKQVVTIDATMRAIFRKYDKDRSGYIDSDELNLVLKDLGLSLTDKQVMALYREIDQDQSGQIEIEELAAWWHLRHRQAFAPKKADDGKVGSKEDIHPKKSQHWRGEGKKICA